MVSDPTGAGDAFRGGLLKGLADGRDWATCCRMGSVAAAFAVEQYGTQEHRFDWRAFEKRFESQFGTLPPIPPCPAWSSRGEPTGLLLTPPGRAEDTGRH
jgi:hypothetical protein